MHRISVRVGRALDEAIRGDEIELPTLPEVALQIRDVAQDEMVTAQKLSDVIARDPALSARLMKFANSPMMRGAQAIDDLQNAVSRMGVEFAANLAVGLAMENMFQATTQLIDKKLRQVWSASTDTATVAMALARSFTELKPDEALLAGLTHHIGALPILAYAEENESDFPDAFTLDTVIDDLHAVLGEHILRVWGFNEGLVSVPRNFDNYGREPHDTDYADVVMVAHLQLIGSSAHQDVDWADIEAFKNLGLDPSVDSAQMEELSLEVADASGALA